MLPSSLGKEAVIAARDVQLDRRDAEGQPLHLPAWVISGAIHVVLIGTMLIFFSGNGPGALAKLLLQ